ncbi:hypothetical protein HK405_004716 [Cladochytrium tenue]|nr:hypothetical protein HK405_004716 [Cladochytrium tenue]
MPAPPTLPPPGAASHAAARLASHPPAVTAPPISVSSSSPRPPYPQKPPPTDVTAVLAPATRAGLRGFLLGCFVRASASAAAAVVRLVVVRRRRPRRPRPSSRGQPSPHLPARHMTLASPSGVLAAVLRAVAAFLAAPVRGFVASLSDGKAPRFGLLLGCFGFLWKGKKDALHGFVSGFVGGLALLAETRSRRNAIALQMFTRGLQGAFTSLDHRGILRIPHGDSAVFVFSSAQILHAFASDPASLPSSLRGLLDPTRNPSPAESATAALQPPAELSPPSAGLWAFFSALLKVFPIFSALNLAPLIALKPRMLVRNPAPYLARAVVSSARSASMIAVLVGSFKILLGLLERTNDATGRSLARSSLWTWAAGAASGTAIFIESRKRRTELAVYLFPRGLTTLHASLARNRVASHALSAAPPPPLFAEVLIFSVGAGLIFALHQSEPHSLGAVVRILVSAYTRRLDDSPSTPVPPPPPLPPSQPVTSSGDGATAGLG